MSNFITNLQSPAPVDYVAPPFPSLYWPLPVRGPQAYYLYYASDIWRFTLYWTFLFYAGVHIVTAGYAVLMQWRSWKVIWIVPVVYALIGGIEALIAGSIVGGLIGGVYNSGYFRMSTWIPFVWAFINTLILILSSFAIQGRAIVAEVEQYDELAERAWETPYSYAVQDPDHQPPVFLSAKISGRKDKKGAKVSYETTGM